MSVTNTWGGWSPNSCTCGPWMSITPPPPCPVHTAPQVWQYPSNPVIQTWPSTTTTGSSFSGTSLDDYYSAVYLRYQRHENRLHRRIGRWLRRLFRR